MRLALLLAALVAALAVGVARPQAAPAHRLGAFSGTGSWVSIYDGAALRNPDRVIATLRAHRVHTLFVETSNDKQARDIAHPLAVSRLIDAAHAAHIAVVGWYLPSFVAPRREIRRALAGARFRSAGGHGFDAFALDIEATNVRSLRLRTSRAVWVAHNVRAAMPPSMALGGITIDPVGARYWSGYPFAGLSHSVDIFLPMEYFTDRTRGARKVAAYSRANIALVRRLAGDPAFPVHPIGGETHEATPAEVKAFLLASGGTVGVSLWEYGETTPRQWALLARADRRP
ncbi:MAG TPA: hypothetical protein VHC67_05190 [Gaiellaceae bacterium]|nr:hypothetical protein [Gaiellaceae bacterium]